MVTEVNTLKKAHLKKMESLLVFSLILFFVLVVLQQANPLTTKLGVDSGIYLYVSNSFLKGGLPYISATETKPPGIFYIDAFALWIGRGTRWGVWLVEFLFLLTASYAGFFLFKRKFGHGPAVISTVAWLLGLNLVLEGGNLTEEYSLLFGFGALLFWTISENTARTFWFDIGVGLCMGFSALLRPNNIGVQVAIVVTMALFYFLERKYFSLFLRLIVIGITSTIPLLLSGVYFYSRGAFTPFIEASFIYNFSYTGSNLDFREAFLIGINSLGVLSGFALPGYFVAIGQLHQQIFRKSVSPFLVWLIVDGIVEVFLSGLSGRNYQHYFICWLPAIASSTAILIYFVFPSLCEWSERNFSGFLLASVGLALLLNSNVFDNYLQSARLLLARPAGVVQKSDQIAEYINENTAPADLVLIWGGRVGINFLSKRDAPTAYIFYPLFVPSKVTERISASYYQQIHENPPVLIVDGSYLVADGVIPLSVIDPIKWAEGHGLYAPPYLDEVFEFVHENYSIKTTINGVPIYKKIQ